MLGIPTSTTAAEGIALVQGHGYRGLARSVEEASMSLENIVGDLLNSGLLASAGRSRPSDLEAEVLLLHGQLIQKNAQLAGLRAQIRALKAECPNSKLLEPNGQIYKDPDNAGKLKSGLTMIYEAAHDDAAEAMGVTEPHVIRAY